MINRNLSEEYICNKFLDLVEEKPFYRIKVKDFAEYAGISRSTFYTYFDSIYDVVQRIEDNFMEGFIPTDDAIAIMVNGDLQAVYGQNEYFERHAREILLLTGTNGDPLFEYRLEKHFRNLNSAIWNVTKTDYSSEMKECLSAYLAAGNVAFIKWWISHLGEYSNEEFISMLEMLMIDASRLLLKESKRHFLRKKNKDD